jgi:hypothetical protein
MKTCEHVIPQIRLRTNLVAGVNDAGCQQKLQHLYTQLDKKCSKRVVNRAQGYAPYLETEMKPWQAGDV